MHLARYVYRLALTVCVLLTAGPSTALDITLDSGAGSQTIVDNDVNDLDITVGTIEFDVLVGGKLQARGRLREAVATIVRTVNLAAIPPDTHATFRNVDVAAATFTITANSSTYATTGPPLGWTVYYTADADDPTPDDVEITSNSVEALVQPGPTSIETVVGPVISPPVPPGMQPVAIDPNAGRGSDVTGTATATRMVLTFTAGPGDEIRIPDSEPFYGTGLEVFVYNQEYRCIDKMNKRCEHITKKAGKAAESCVKDNSPGSSTPCTTGLTSFKIDQAESKLLADYAAYCAPVPAWGVNGGTCCENGSNDGAVCAVSSPDCDVGGTCTEGACISGAAERAVRDLALDIFGGTAQIGVDDVNDCQRKVMKDAGRVLSTRWKTFRKCKKSSATTITDDATLVGTCLGPPQVDASGKILNKEIKLEINVQKACIDDGVVPVGSAFPGGICSGQPDGSFGACVNSRAACRFCLAVNVADDIVPALDCDVFDDGASNGSCP